MQSLACTGFLGVRETHCKPVRSATAERPMASTSARDCADDASTTGAICNSTRSRDCVTPPLGINALSSLSEEHTGMESTNSPQRSLYWPGLQGCQFLQLIKVPGGSCSDTERPSHIPHQEQPAWVPHAHLHENTHDAPTSRAIELDTQVNHIPRWRASLLMHPSLIHVASHLVL